MTRSVENKVVKAFTKIPEEGVSVSEFARISGVNRLTAIKYLEKYSALGKIKLIRKSFATLVLKESEE